MGLTSSFKITWPDFVATWCLNNAPGFSYDDVDTAFSALERLWPERLAEFFKWVAKGAAAVGPLVHHGSLLESCERLRGFERVLNR